MKAAKKSVPTGPLHVAFTGALSARLRTEASRLGVKPYVLVGATMQKLVEDSLLDAVLDGGDAADLAPGYAYLINGLTRNQGAVIYLLARATDEFGVSRMTTKRITAAVPGMTVTGAQKVLGALERHGLAARAQSPEKATRVAWCLTEDGWRVAKTLGEFDRSRRHG